MDLDVVNISVANVRDLNSTNVEHLNYHVMYVNGEMPHFDTVNNFLKRLEVPGIENIRDYMIRELLKKRSLEKYKLLDKYWCIAIDESQLFSENKQRNLRGFR